MNAISPGMGHNMPPSDPPPPADPTALMRAALDPRFLSIMLDAELAPHIAATQDLLTEFKRFTVATAHGIDSDEVDAAAVDFAEDLKDALGALDATRTAIKAPVLAAQRAIDGAAKDIADPVVAARTEVQRRHTAFLLAKDALIRQQAIETANRAEEAAWAARQEANATGDVAAFAEAELASVAQREAEKVVSAPVLETTRMKTATGNTSGLKDDWKYEVTDIAAVPAAYLQINDKVLKAAIASGTRSLPGLRIFNQPKAR